MQDRIRIYQLDPTQGLKIRQRNAKYINNDRAIKALVLRFDEIQNPTNEQIIKHLRALQYRLAGNNFDEL